MRMNKLIFHESLLWEKKKGIFLSEWHAYYLAVALPENTERGGSGLGE